MNRHQTIVDGMGKGSGHVNGVDAADRVHANVLMTDVAAHRVGSVRSFGPCGVFLASHRWGDMRRNAPPRGNCDAYAFAAVAPVIRSAGRALTESFAWPVVDFVGDPL